MLLDAGHRKWIVAMIVLFIVATAIYVPYARNAINGPSGGSWTAAERPGRPRKADAPILRSRRGHGGAQGTRSPAWGDRRRDGVRVGWSRHGGHI